MTTEIIPKKIIPKWLIYRSEAYEIAKIDKSFHVDGFTLHLDENRNLLKVVIGGKHPNADPESKELDLPNCLLKTHLAENTIDKITRFIEIYNLNDAYFVPVEKFSLSEMLTLEKCEEIFEGLYSSPAIEVAIIYDTSYLMDGNAKMILDFREIPPEEYIKYHFKILHFVPFEVQMEIAKHINDINDKDKNTAARAARALYARILTSANYCESSLADIPIPDIHEKVLGPDSETDKKIIGLAYKLLEEGKAVAVFIATRDGGIAAEVVYQCTKNGRPVYCDMVWKQFTDKIKEIGPSVRKV